MKPISVTFGEFLKTIREAARQGDFSKLIKFFPETGQESVSGDFDSLKKWYENPASRPKLIEEGRIFLKFPFFHEEIPNLIEKYELLYENEEIIAEAEKAFSWLCPQLKEIRRRMKVAKYGAQAVTIQEDFKSIIEKFNSLLPEEIRPSLSIRLTNDFPKSFKAKFLWFDSDYTLEWLNRLIDWADSYLLAFRKRPKRGRPVKPFNALLFHAINAFTHNKFDPKTRKIIQKDGKIRLVRNWRLIFAALIWIHVLYDLPEMRRFIKANENKDLETAIKNFISWAKREYSHFRASKKGRAKWGTIFPADLSEIFIGFEVPLIEKSKILITGL
jgi:hypothetical protein